MLYRYIQLCCTIQPYIIAAALHCTATAVLHCTTTAVLYRTGCTAITTMVPSGGGTWWWHIREPENQGSELADYKHMCYDLTPLALQTFFWTSYLKIVGGVLAVVEF